MTPLRIALLLLAIAIAAIVVRLLDRRRTVYQIEQYGIPKRVVPGDFPGFEAGPLILLFTHADCRACNVARRIAGEQGLPIIEIDGRENPDLLTKYGIDGVPATLLVYESGRVAEGWVGPLNRAKVVAAVGGLVAESPGDED